MSPSDRILLDLLRQAGFELLTPWHLLCVETYLAQGGVYAPERCFVRLMDELAVEGLDQLHEAALLEERQHAAQRQLNEAVQRVQLRDDVGRYAVGMDALCRCGHPKGQHLAGPTGRGAHECIAGDFGATNCDCQKFRKAR